MLAKRARTRGLLAIFALGTTAGCGSGDDSGPPTKTGGSGSGGTATSGGAAGTSTGGAAGATGGAAGATGGAAGATGGSSAAGSGGGGAAGNGAGSGGSAGAAGSGAGGSGGANGGSGGAEAGSGGSAGVDAGAAGSSGAAGSGGSAGSSWRRSGSSGSYDALVLSLAPVGYWPMVATSGTEADLSGHGHDGSYRGGTPATGSLPNGDSGAVFDGSSQYLTIPSHASFSIPTAKNFTWEAWISPTELEFPNDSNGYVDWMGKCESYSPTCEWEARMYKTTNPESRCNRISAYVFNPSAGLGSAADWQPTCGLLEADAFYHVVGEYTLESEPSDCQNASSYPGSIEIWVNGVKWDHGSHGQTGCMSQYSVVPQANDSPVNVGTMAGDAWFPGMVAKVAFYDFLLSQAEITAHYQAMTGATPSGSCGNTCSF